MHARLGDPNNLLIQIEPDFPCLADVIAKPCPDMNIKVAAFTVSEKSINTSNLLQFKLRFFCFLIICK